MAGKSKKPSKELLNQLVALDRQIDKLYTKKDKLKKELVEKYGTQDFVFELEAPTTEGHKFLRLKVVDNLKAFEQGVPMFKSVAVCRFHYELNYLKNKPKED